MSQDYLKKSLKSLQCFKRSFDLSSFQRATILLKEMVCATSVEEELSEHVYLRILPLIAIYCAELEMSSNVQESKRKVFAEFHRKKAVPAAKFLRGLMKLPLLHRILPKMAAYSIRSHYKSSPQGFQHEEVKRYKDEYRVNILKCPYFDFCERFGVPELAEAFCISDEICYANIHSNIAFERQGTIARGADCCDFCFRVIDRTTAKGAQRGW